MRNNRGSWTGELARGLIGRRDRRGDFRDVSGQLWLADRQCQGERWLGRLDEPRCIVFVVLNPGRGVD